MPPIKYNNSFLRKISRNLPPLVSQEFNIENEGYDHYTEYDRLIKLGYTDKEAIEYLNNSMNRFPDEYYIYAGQLPEVVITPSKNTRNDVVLTTYYPGTSKYWATGHSRLDTPGGNHINVMSKDPNYNLLTNNCSDATREALELATGKKINPWFFTTPGDVRSFAEDVLNGKSFDNGDGSVLTFINLPQFLINKIAQYAKNLQNERRLMNKRKIEERRLRRLAERGPYKNNNL